MIWNISRFLKYLNSLPTWCDRFWSYCSGVRSNRMHNIVIAPIAVATKRIAFFVGHWHVDGGQHYWYLVTYILCTRKFRNAIAIYHFNCEKKESFILQIRNFSVGLIQNSKNWVFAVIRVTYEIYGCARYSVRMKAISFVLWFRTEPTYTGMMESIKHRCKNLQ